MVWHNPRSTMPEDAKLVPAAEAHEHGYWGQVPDREDNETYTAAGAHKASQREQHAQATRAQEWAKADRDRDQGDDGADKTPARRSPARKG